jgi:hypothetical protein
VIRRSAAVLLVLALVTSVWAQDATILGTIDGTVDGEPVQWYQIELPGPGGATPLSSWSSPFAGIHEVTLQGFQEPRFMLEGAIAISLSLTGGLPTDCPCRYDAFSASLLYLSEGSMTESLYVSDEGGDASVVIDVFEPVGEDAYRVTGSFEARLVFVRDLASGPDPDDAIDVAGTFTIEPLPREPLD